MNNKYKKTKLACYGGYTVQAVINNFLPILFVIFKKEYNLSYESLGRLIFINFFVQIFADMTTPFIVKRIGFKKSAVLCQGLAALGLVLLAVLTGVISNTYLGIVIAVVFYAFGSGIVEVVISPIMEYLPTENKAGNMAVLHSFYCWGQSFTILVTTLIVKLSGYEMWRLVPLVWAVIPLLNMFFFATVPVVEPKSTAEEKKKNLFADKKFYYLILFMIASGASEIAMSQWASIFAQNGLKISKFQGDLLGPCAFGIFMGIGRVLYAKFSDRIPYLKIMTICSAFTAVCYFVVGFTGNPVISLTACALCGITVSMFWPGTLSFAVKTFPMGGTLMFSVLALSGDLGCSSGPWLLGIIADKTGLNSGFTVCAVFPLVIVLVAFLFSKEKN